MTIRIRAILVIILTTLVIIAFSILVGVIFVRGNIESAQEADLMVISDIADHFISGEIEFIKHKTSQAAVTLSEFEETQWPDILKSFETSYPEFVGAAVFKAGQGLLATSGDFPASEGIMDYDFIRQTFQGKAMISSTVPSPDGIVFYSAAPFPGEDGKVLAFTLPGTYFSDLVAIFTIWETGHIFIDDAEGRLVSNIRPQWVVDRVNFVDRAGIDESNKKTINDIRQGLEFDARLVRYSINDVPRLCVYRPVGGSEEGWLFGTVAPLTESPFRYTDRGLVLVGVVSMFLGIIAAVVASDFIARVHNKIIEEMRRAEIAEESNKAKDRFLMTMSHEIRTPMNSIMGFAELAMTSPDNIITPKIKDYFTKILDNTKWLLHIINDVLDISQIESGRMELEHEPFDLQDVFAFCQSVIMPGAKEKGLVLHVRTDPPIGKKLMGDHVRLSQVIINLLSNAVKFTSTGTIWLTSHIKSMDSGKAVVYFEVKDNGIGMTSEQIERIFERFMQADSRMTREYGGMGLGLPIAQNMLELMDSRLVVGSEPGAGSIFGFEIVFDTADIPENTLETGPSDFLQKPHFSGLVLICDDNEMNQQVICEHLANVGLDTVVAENGKIGVDIVRERMQKGEKPFDLILMDILMPVMDGIEAATKIIELGVSTPIVAITANIMESDLESYRKNGMPDYLGKPFTSRELWRVLLKHFTDEQYKVQNADADAEVEVESESDYDDDMRKMLRARFFKDNQRRYEEIVEAIETGDAKLAHRLAHSLKGNAGMIRKTELQSSAAELESLLKKIMQSELDFRDIPDSLKSALKTNLESVIEELRPLVTQKTPGSESQIPNQEQTLVLFEKLKTMLENLNPECMNLLNELSAIPGTEELVMHVEQFDFESASKTLAELMKKYKSY